MNRKKLFVLLLSAVFFLTFVACSQTFAQPEPTVTAGQNTPDAAAEGVYTPGTYSSTARGRNAEMVVEVTFDSNKITEVKVLQHEETEGIGDIPIERIPAQIVEYQSLKVDTVAEPRSPAKR